jgi:hypothetical protein
VSEHLTLSVEVAAPAERVFAAMTDWPGQGRWMVGTGVSALSPPGHGAGAELEAFTGVGRLGFLDTMTVTTWDPPRRVDVRHTGRVVRGTGSFEVVALGSGRSRFVWGEQLVMPGGAVGRAGWRVVRPIFRVGLRRSLAAFARLVEAGELGAG